MHLGLCHFASGLRHSRTWNQASHSFRDRAHSSIAAKGGNFPAMRRISLRVSTSSMAFADSNLPAASVSAFIRAPAIAASEDENGLVRRSRPTSSASLPFENGTSEFENSWHPHGEWLRPAASSRCAGSSPSVTPHLRFASSLRAYEWPDNPSGVRFPSVSACFKAQDQSKIVIPNS